MATSPNAQPVVDALADLERTVRRMHEDGHPYGEGGGDEWFAILHERLLAVEVAREAAA